jgi:iron complex outermembrane receptor protein
MNIKHFTIRGRLALGGAAIAIAAGLASPASAQERAGAGETEAQVSNDIVVTAQRREQSLQDVPIAITAVTAETLQDQNVQSVEDYFALTPNVSFQSNGSRDRKDLSIRGISNQLNPYADVRQSTYAFYIDEFNVAAGTSNPQIVDLERIEVLRGPQGTYFGRNAVGGAINVITKKPVNRFEGFVDVGYSSFDTYRAEGALNVPVVDGLLAVRASGKYEKSDGYIKNINPIGGGNDSEYYNYRIQGRFTPASNFTLDVNYSYSDEQVGMRNGIPTGFVTATWARFYYGATSAGYIGNPDGVGLYPGNDNRVNFNRPQNVGGTVEYLSGRALWELGDVAITGVLGTLKSSVFNFGDVDGGSPDFFYEDLKLIRKSTSGELRVQSTGNGNFFDWSVGMTAGRDTGDMNQSTWHGRQSPLCPPGSVGGCAGLEATGLDSVSSSDYWAVFGQGTLNVTEKLAATVGLRYSRETVMNDSVNRSNALQTAVNDRTAKFEDVSPKFTLSYKANPDLMIFATASRGFKSGGTQTSNNVNLLNAFEPETLWNYELGTKFDLLDGKLRVDVTGFYMDWKNVQQTIRFQYVGPNNQILGVSGIANAAGAESYGAEASFDLRVTPEFTLSGNVGYNHATFKDYPNALIDGVVVNVTGQQLVNAPEWTLGAQAQYKRRLVGDLDGFVRAEWNFRDTMISNPYYYRYRVYPFVSPSYHNVNLRAGVETDTIRVVVFVENLFDAQYFANAYEKAFYSGVQVEPSYRVIGGSIGFKF